MSSLNSLIEKLAGAQPVDTTEEVSSSSLTDPVYVEKLASAIDFIIEATGGASPHQPAAETETEKVASVTDISDRLRETLRDKLAAKKREGSADPALIQSVLGKLKAMKSEQKEEDKDEEVKDESPDVSEEESEENVDSKEESKEEPAVAKAASVDDLSLADVLREALNPSTDEQIESASEEDVKTASVRGGEGPMARSEVTQMLKERLMAKVGEEE